MENQNQNNTKKDIDEDGAESAVTGDNNAELEVCQKQAGEYLNNWKRERADFVNYKKDEAKRMAEFVMFANEALILELLDLMDDLYVAAKESKDTGLGQVVKKFEDWLKKYEVEKIKVEGEKFDPLKHEAVESEDDGEKLQEIRAGYTMHGKIIRPARVKVVK